jgi:hypothetical protein
MRTLWRTLVRSIFWSYERGTWQYDVAVVVIVVFVLFSPLVIHFNDEPAVGPPPAQTMVELRALEAGQIATYRMDARLLSSPLPTPQLEHDLHTALQRYVDALRAGRFEIVRVEPIPGDGGTIVYYDVAIKR